MGTAAPGCPPGKSPASFFTMPFQGSARPRSHNRSLPQPVPEISSCNLAGSILIAAHSEQVKTPRNEVSTARSDKAFTPHARAGPRSHQQHRWGVLSRGRHPAKLRGRRPRLGQP